jgi:hypothetical protein
MYFLYSFIVVAQIKCKVHLAKLGFSKFEASPCHSLAQAQTIVWISSINNIIFPCDFSVSFITAFNLSSNSHLYLAPASNAHISRVTIFLPLRLSGTSLFAILSAIHSIIAVFQTQGSQTKTGLFLVLLDNICKVLLISSSLPITGSIFHFLANSTKSIQYFFKAFILFSGSLSVTFSPFLIVFMISSIFSFVIKNDVNIFFTVLSQNCINAKNRCSSVVKSSFIFSAIF